MKRGEKDKQGEPCECCICGSSSRTHRVAYGKSLKETGVHHRVMIRIP